MNQQSLFPDGGIMVPNVPAQRHSATSVEAAASMSGEPVERARRKVLEAFRAAPDGLTDREVERITGLIGSCARPRRIELVKAGLVRDSGKKRPTDSGRLAVVWELTGS